MLSSLILLSLCGAIWFAFINFFSYKISKYVGRHKASVLSLFGGVTATYVFLDLLPSLEQSSQYLKQIGGSIPLITLYEDAIFLVVLVGFLLFFVLEHAAVRSRRKTQMASGEGIMYAQASRRLFLLHLFTVAFPCFIFSYLFIFELEAGALSAALYLTAVSMHLFITSETMLEHYKRLQATWGRYVLSAVPLVGWVASLFFPESIAEAYVLLAFISGVILYHAIRGELPTTLRRTSIVFFLVGALVYAAILVGHAIISA
ncbi:MAG: hypothetical protein NWE93_02905 [Candidatus Bathyarchaeota archaeon]|nr:hypothetical protein [Candidatus Bathyarchaeota archaeon]